MSGSIQMPKYKCHKEVWALKIKQVKAESAERFYLHFADKRYAPLEIDKEWMGKHKPSDGGYYVQYQDGYASYSPAEAFESGYAPVEVKKSNIDLFRSLPKWANNNTNEVVGAFLIQEINIEPYGALLKARGRLRDVVGPVHVDKQYVDWYQPRVGNYFIVTKGGEFSYESRRDFEPVYGFIDCDSMAEDEDELSSQLDAENLEVPDPSKNEMSVAFRLAAQIAGVKDEVSDFMAGLDGALLAGKSVEDLCDELQERIALYDTPEAVDLFMQMVKGRSGVELPELVKEIIRTSEEPEQKLIFTVETSGHKPGCVLSPSVGLALFEFNQAQVQSLGMAYRSLADLSDDEKAAYGKATELPFVASNGFKVSWYNAAAIAEVMGGTNKTNQQGQIELLTAALDAARHELDGKYISATATVIDAYQLPAAGEPVPNSFVEWCDKVGFTDYTSERDEGLDVHTLCGPLRANPGDWIIKQKMGSEQKVVFNVFEPEVFATLYTSAAELLK